MSVVNEAPSPPAEQPVKKRFKHAGNGQPCRNWLFAAKEPIVGLEAALDQMFKGYQYHSKLRELNLAWREAGLAIVRAAEPRLDVLMQREAELAAQRDALLEELMKKRQKARKKIKDPELQEKIKAFREPLKELRKELRELRKATYARPDLQAQLQASGEAYKTARKAARRDSQLYPGTYQLVEEAASKMGQGAPPKKKFYRGDGRVGIQIQNGILWSRIESGEGGATLLQLHPETHPRRQGIERQTQKPRWALLYFRVNSADSTGAVRKGGGPLWCILPVRLHREIPADAVVKWAVVHRRVTGQEVYAQGARHKHGATVRWTVMLTLQRPSWPKHDAADEGLVAVNFGYRRVEGGLRVARAKDADGKERTLILPDAWLDQLEKACSIQSERDQELDRLRPRLVEFRNQYETSLPDWWRDQTKTMHWWKSPAAFARLIVNWRFQRFPGDEQIFPIAEAWRKRDSHLGRYCGGIRRRFQNRRKDLYRKWACDLRRSYRQLVIGTFRLTDLLTNPSPESEGPEVAATQKRALTNASLGELRDCLRNSMLETIELASAWTTQTCNNCGQREKFDAAKSIWHTCSKCGALWDQDSNNCDNLLQAYKQQLAAGTLPNPEEKSADNDDLEPVDLED